MPYGWGGNPRSGIALAMRHRFQWFMHLREMSTLPTFLVGYGMLYFFKCVFDTKVYKGVQSTLECHQDLWT